MSTKISQLTSATDVTANDLIQIVDVEDGVMAPSGTNKKATASLLANQLVPLISSGAIAGSKIADSGITSAKIADGTIVNADINASAAIAGTKISPSFGSQDIITTGSLSAGIGSVIAGSGTEDALRVTQTGTGNSLLIEESTNPDSTPFLIDASGNVISGYTASVVNAGSATAPRIQFHGLGGGASTTAITSWTTGTANGPTLLLSRADSGAIGSHTIVDAEDQLGKLSYAGSDGTQFIEAAMISAHSDGTPSVGDMPGRLMFSTTADGASTVTERMRINSSGDVGIGTASPSSRLHIQDDVVDGLTNAGLIVSSFQPRIILNDRTSGAGYVDIRNPSGGGAPQLIIGYGSNTDFGVRTGERLRIDTNGNVGIGAISGGEKLNVTHTTTLDPSSARVTSGIFVQQDGGTAGDGALGGALTLSKINSNRPGACLVAYQDGADPDVMGLKIYTHSSPTTNDVVNEAIAITGGGGLLISHTGVTTPAPPDGNVFSGTYTPTLTNTTNISASTSFSAHYMRVGNVVTVSGNVNIDPVATATSTIMNISLPIVSTFSSQRNLSGVGADITTTQFSRIYADSTNNSAAIQFIALDATNRTHSFTFTYQVI